MDSVTSSSSAPSVVPSPVDAFAGSPGSNSPTSPQALGEAAVRQNRPSVGDTPSENVASADDSAIPAESAYDSAADLPPDDFDFAGEISKSLAESMRFFAGPGYAPAKRILCKLVGTLMTETLIALDDAMSQAVESEHYNPNVAGTTAAAAAATPACGEGEGSPDEFDAMFPPLSVVTVTAEGAERLESIPDPRASFARRWSDYGGSVKVASEVSQR